MSLMLEQFNNADGSKKLYMGSFQVNYFEQLLVKCKRPVIISDLKTIVYCADSHLKSLVSDVGKITNLLTRMSDNEISYEENIFIKSLQKFDLKSEKYNMFGLEYPIIVCEDSDYIIEINDKDKQDTSYYYRIMA